MQQQKSKSGGDGGQQKSCTLQQMVGGSVISGGGGGQSIHKQQRQHGGGTIRFQKVPRPIGSLPFRGIERYHRTGFRYRDDNRKSIINPKTGNTVFQNEKDAKLAHDGYKLNKLLSSESEPLLEESLCLYFEPAQSKETRVETTCQKIG